MPPEMTYPTTLPNWLAETGFGVAQAAAPARRPGGRG